MKFKPDKTQITWAITIFITVVFSLLFYYLLFHGNNIAKGIRAVNKSMASVACGILIAYIMSPTLNFIEKRILFPIYRKAGIEPGNDAGTKTRRKMRKLSVFMTIAFLIFILYALLAIIIPQLLKSISDIVSNLPVYVNNINHMIDSYLTKNPDMADSVNDILDTAYKKINSFIDDSITPNISEIITDISKRFVDFFKGIINFIIGIIVAVYLLNSKERMCGQFKKMAYAFFKEKDANEIISSFRFIHYTFIGFITGKIVDSIIIGCMCYVGCIILKIPYPILVSVIVGATNIIPFFGPYIGAIVGSIILVMINPLSALIYLIFVIILQQFDGNILGPKILGDSTGLSSFWVIFAIMLFGSLFGVFGWIIGVPVFAVFYAFVRKLTNHFLTEKKLPDTTSSYIDLAYLENGKFESLNDTDNIKYNSKRPGSAWKKIFHISNGRKDSK